MAWSPLHFSEAIPIYAFYLLLKCNNASRMEWDWWSKHCELYTVESEALFCLFLTPCFVFCLSLFMQAFQSRVKPLEQASKGREWCNVLASPKPLLLWSGYCSHLYEPSVRGCFVEGSPGQELIKLKRKRHLLGGLLPKMDLTLLLPLTSRLTSHILSTMERLSLWARHHYIIVAN